MLIPHSIIIKPGAVYQEERILNTEYARAQTLNWTILSQISKQCKQGLWLYSLSGAKREWK
jgi:hypothetical protein